MAAGPGCAAKSTEPTAGSGPVMSSSLRKGRVRSIRMQLSHAQSRIRELETALAEQPEAAARNAERVAELEAREQELTDELTETREQSEVLEQQLAAARAETEAALAAARTAGDSAEVARLEAELTTERERRIDAEDQLARLREETSASPYETAPEPALAEAQAEIQRLNDELGRERSARDDLEKRFADLQVQLEEQRAMPAPAAVDPEVAALQEDQRRLMAGIQQDLEASRRREAELRETITTLQAGGNAGLTEKVQDLESENEALQASLDAEHDRNVELAAKLEVATRVADLIFKMRREGRVPQPEELEEAAR